MIAVAFNTFFSYSIITHRVTILFIFFIEKYNDTEQLLLQKRVNFL